MTLWRVIIKNRDSGIIESNYAWAEAYWKERARVRKLKIRLEPIT